MVSILRKYPPLHLAERPETTIEVQSLHNLGSRGSQMVERGLENRGLVHLADKRHYRQVSLGQKRTRVRVLVADWYRHYLPVDDSRIKSELN